MALRSIGTNYRGDDARLEASTAAPWYLAWLSRFKSDHPDIPVVVVQAYGFAKASAGVHAGGWCVDFQIWHLTNSQIRRMIQHLRAWGAGASWERNSLDGMEPHIHATIDSDGADSHSAYQTVAVKNGRNGLVNNARDRYADLNPSRWLTAKQALEILEATLAVTRDEMKLIANYTGTDVWNSTMGSAGTAAQLMPMVKPRRSLYGVRIWGKPAPRRIFCGVLVLMFRAGSRHLTSELQLSKPLSRIFVFTLECNARKGLRAGPQKRPPANVPRLLVFEAGRRGDSGDPRSFGPMARSLGGPRSEEGAPVFTSTKPKLLCKHVG